MQEPELPTEVPIEQPSQGHMTPEVMPPAPASGLRTLLSAPAALLLGVLAFLIFLALLPDAPSGTPHLTAIAWQSQPSERLVGAPPSVNSAALPATWRGDTLPFAPPVALLAQAQAKLNAEGLQTTWIRALVPPHLHTAGPLALYGVRVKTDGTVAVYVDGRLAHKTQVRGPLWNSNRTPLWVELDADVNRATPHEVLIRLEHTRKSRIALSSLWLGPAEALQTHARTRVWLQQDLPMMLNGAFIAVGVFALCVWFKRRGETEYLLFFFLATTAFARGLHFYSDRPIANDWFGWMTVNALFWMVTAVHVFMCQLHDRPLRWLTRTLLVSCLLMGALSLPIWPWPSDAPTLTPLIYVAAGLLSAVVALVGGVNTWRSSADGRLVAMGVGVCTVLGVDDWLLQNNVISPEGWYLGAYTNALTFLVFGALMFRRYVRAINEVRDHNAKLAARLQAREAELELSHRRLRQAEMKEALSEERQRLMQDMHDGLGSSLISAIRSVEDRQLNPQWVSRVLKDCLDDLKLAIDSMEPVDADLLMLLATLRFRLEPRLEGTRVQMAWEVHELPALTWLDPSSALHILRILQESIANVLRHSQATQITVSTAHAGDGVQVMIEDNGGGFDVAAALTKPSGRGLQNQLRRASALGGRVSWQSDASGTLFTLWLPLTPQRKT
jgi:signal transduction histidine kinase